MHSHNDIPKESEETECKQEELKVKEDKVSEHKAPSEYPRTPSTKKKLNES